MLNLTWHLPKEIDVACKHNNHDSDFKTFGLLIPLICYGT